MITRADIRKLLIFVSLVWCGLLFVIVSPLELAYGQGFTYSTSAGSEAKSSWNLSLTIAGSAGGIGEQSATLNYSPNVAPGTFSALVNTENAFGRFRLYGTFALADYPAGSNVSLVEPGGGGWVNTPIGNQAWLVDYITVSSQQKNVDLALPIVMHGSFDKSGTPMDNGELGLSGEVSLLLTIRSMDSTYRDNTSFSITDADYAPGTYWLTLKGVPTNVPLKIQFICNASYTVTDEIQYTDINDPYPYTGITESHILSTVFTRTGTYSLNGTVDFYDGILFGWYAASKDGNPVPDLNITSTNAFAYAPVPYNVCPLFDQSKSVKAGAVIPIKLQLCDGYGINLSSPSLVLTGTQLKRVADNKVVALQSAGRSNDGSIFRYDPTLEGYIYTVSTKGLAPGTYQLSFVVGEEPLEYSVNFDVR